MILGIERLCENVELRTPLRGRRVAFLGHPASVNHKLEHSIDLLFAQREFLITSAFGPEHGIKGDKQNNMAEVEDELDSVYQIPIFSLYGKVRRPTAEMMSTFDVILIDLQDVGCRVYTYLRTLHSILEESSKYKKSVWILDRPNPIGRPTEGQLLKSGWESFVGTVGLPMRHGLTFGELARWMVDYFKIDLDLKVIEMKDYNISQGPGHGWPLSELSWVNPSPNAANITMARCFPGSVLLDGTNLSEGRGTTRPLEVVGSPDLNFDLIKNSMQKLAPSWVESVLIRNCFFEPTFHKYVGRRCNGLQFHTDFFGYDPKRFRPYRLFALLLKAIRLNYPEYPLWLTEPLEYETQRRPIDVLNGGPELREWVENPQSDIHTFEMSLTHDEEKWNESRKKYISSDYEKNAQP